ncbi:PhzF family phenazine biosynthesis protein [Bacillus sp. 3255]|uniref:PhzF family phenazine biosynthesis protein n=1 Tax=Bacillus sp. 3255 TaxID=2817904 RepID=UPI0028622C56|nr:PhzF family phenazine biosynthesis protein [Bacillus sp. 3255]MDR6881210.1 PhzF family phenazine biosynthesis protein [Bacillus sp. 3255]
MVTVHHYDAFSQIPNKGNPAGVVLTGEALTADEMQRIAAQVGFNETAFPLKSDKADLRIRFFTPGHEINLCGHATMATIYAMHARGLLNGQTELTIETGAGVLPVHIQAADPAPAEAEARRTDGGVIIRMQQAPPQFQAFHGSMGDLAASMGITEDDIETSLPTVYGSTGTWTLLVPVKSLAAFRAMKPVNEQFPAVLKEMPRASVHPFCLAAYDARAHMHARHFSSPYSGTVEDPVTGTASGVMGAYYAKYIERTTGSLLSLTVEQGHEIGRDGRIGVSVDTRREPWEIAITGTAVHVKDFEV